MSNAPTQSADSTDQTPLVSTSQINPSDVPEFERDVAGRTQMSAGNQGATTIAQVNPDNPKDNVVVDDPTKYTAAVQAHELTHNIQRDTGDVTPVNTAQATSSQAASNTVYDYGGTEGLDKVMKSGGISKLNDEQQAKIPENYMKEYVKAEKSGDPKAVDKLNATYEPAIRQLRNMANTSKDTINTTPDAPGAPPVGLTGLAKALPGMYSKSTQSVALKSSDVHNPPPKGASKPAPAPASAKQDAKPVAKTSPSVYNGASKVMSGGKKKS